MQFKTPNRGLRDQGLLESTAESVYDELPEDTDKKEHGFLIALAAMLSILVSVLRLNQMCQAKSKTHSAIETVNFPTHGQQTQLKKIVRKEVGWKAYRKYGQDTVTAFLKRGKKLDQADLDVLLKAAEPSNEPEPS